MLVGTLFSSRVCAACMCAGVIIGSLVGAFLGASLCDLASGLYGYDASLSFIAVYYAVCSSSRRKLLHAVAAAAAAALLHTAVGFTMARAGLPSGTLGFVFATMVVVCCVSGSDHAAQPGASAARDVALAPASEEEMAQPEQPLDNQRMIVLQQTFQTFQQQHPHAAPAKVSPFALTDSAQLPPVSGGVDSLPPSAAVEVPQQLQLQQGMPELHSSIFQQV
jgi:hypothetical protein